MTALETAALYYDAWQTKQGDFTDVPLAEDFRFTPGQGRTEGQAVTSFNVRKQFVDGNTVCSIIDWEMAMPGLGRMTSAELLEVVDGVLVRGELIYDAEALRRVMAQATA